MSFFFNQPDPKRRRFPIPNDVWKWELKPQGFAILAYLCYLHVHCNKNALPSADEIASQLHMSKDMAVKQIAELNTWFRYSKATARTFSLCPMNCFS